MNLAQCIDPDWVRAGYPVRHAPVRQQQLEAAMREASERARAEEESRRERARAAEQEERRAAALARAAELDEATLIAARERAARKEARRAQQRLARYQRRDAAEARRAENQRLAEQARAQRRADAEARRAEKQRLAEQRAVSPNGWGRPGERVLAVLRALKARRGPCDLKAVCRDCRAEDSVRRRTLVAAALLYAFNRRLVLRSGERMRYRYELSPEGARYCAAYRGATLAPF